MVYAHDCLAEVGIVPVARGGRSFALVRGRHRRLFVLELLGESSRSVPHLRPRCHILYISSMLLPPTFYHHSKLPFHPLPRTLVVFLGHGIFPRSYFRTGGHSVSHKRHPRYQGQANCFTAKHVIEINPHYFASLESFATKSTSMPSAASLSSSSRRQT
jgi:hypothetical protein